MTCHFFLPQLRLWFPEISDESSLFKEAKAMTRHFLLTRFTFLVFQPRLVAFGRRLVAFLLGFLLSSLTYGKNLKPNLHYFILKNVIRRIKMNFNLTSLVIWCVYWCRGNKCCNLRTKHHIIQFMSLPNFNQVCLMTKDILI